MAMSTGSGSSDLSKWCLESKWLRGDVGESGAERGLREG